MGKTNRRDALKTIAAGAAASTMLPMFGAKATDTRPNVVFILTDDHRYDAFGFMDKPWLKTPNMDRIAAEGVNFENSFVTTSLCSPSRASFLTGQYASCHGVQNNATPWKDSNVTYLERLHAEGYNTGFIGKWHMPGKGVPDLKGQGKVDRMVSFSFGGGQGIYDDCPLIVDDEKVKSKGYLTDILTDYTMEYLDQQKDNPFCLYLSHKAVHHDFRPPERYMGSLDHVDFHDMEKNERNYPMGAVHVPQRMQFEKNQQWYYEALMAVDDSVGSVLKYLDDRGIAENTIVVYAGDNGYYWGEHGLIDKRYCYEEGLRIPMLMRYPRLVQNGGVSESGMALNIDLAPTMLDAAGVEPHAGMQGESWLGLANGSNRNWRDSFLYEYFADPAFPHPPMKAVRTDDWKLITYPGAKKKFKPEMYNIAEDPGERNDLINNPAFADKRKELQTELDRLIKEASC